MNSVSVVVVIVGVVIAAITAATLSDGPKPPTPGAKRKRTPPSPSELEPFVPAFPGAVPPPQRATPPPPTPAPEPAGAAPVPSRTPERVGRPQRLRALALLLVSVVLLGTMAAALIGGTVLLVVRLLDQALG